MIIDSLDQVLQLQNIFHVIPLYIGDADEGTEGIAGHTRKYKYEGKIYVTQDDNIDQKEKVVAIMTADFYNDNF